MTSKTIRYLVQLVTNSINKIMASSSLPRNNSCNSYQSDKLIYPAADRNKQPILDVLRIIIKNEGHNSSKTFLEIASGSGQHIAHFAPNFPEITFQPSEYDKSLIGSINNYAASCPTKNIRQAKFIDIQKNLTTFGVKENSIDFMYNANMIHISPYECTIGLFENAGICLKPKGMLITYGPYGEDGVITPESNISFDASLRMQNPLWGIRDIKDLIELAKNNNLALSQRFDMPSNNKTLVWVKQ